MNIEDRYHYGVIRRAIDEIDAAATPLSLDDLAERMGLSPAHFQRVFSRWAGVSPKRYQQYLMLGHAKALLADRTPVLEVADRLGLSGSGRLHDMFLTWEAMTPGSYARQGKGLVIRWGQFDTPFGPAIAMGTQAGLCGLGFASESSADEVFADLSARWPAAEYLEDPAALADWVRAAFAADGAEEAPPLHLIGGPFQLKVWEALLAIPSGQVTSYGSIADAIGSPAAVRAVGTAIGRNPVSWLIPCHRALRKDGTLGGYRWGLPVKRAMLALESARSDAATPAADARDTANTIADIA